MSVIVIGGATASGKSALAMELAKKYDGEIISADAILVYKGLNIGSAKPTQEERKEVPHYMIDVAEPTDSFSVSDYERLALPILKGILSRGKTAIICGGTGFYIKSLLFKSRFGGTAQSPELRKKYEEFARRNGVTCLHELLREKDPESAEKLHENDVKRVIRALEIYDLTGKKKSEQADDEIPRFDYNAYAIDYPRSELYERIGLRVEDMFRLGLLREVRDLISCGVTAESQSMQAIGYKEVLSGWERGSSETEIMEEIKKNTRNYAKRQITFFKKFPDIKWLKKDEIQI